MSQAPVATYNYKVKKSKIDTYVKII